LATKPLDIIFESFLSETRGTVFFGLDTPRKEVLRTLPRLIPPEDLKYVKIEKKKVGKTMVETVQNIVFCNKKDILKMFEIEKNGYIGTSYVERLNLTIRASLARLIRK